MDKIFKRIAEQAQNAKTVEELREIVIKLCLALQADSDDEDERNAGRDW